MCAFNQADHIEPYGWDVSLKLHGKDCEGVERANSKEKFISSSTGVLMSDFFSLDVAVYDLTFIQLELSLLLFLYIFFYCTSVTSLAE